MTDEVLVRAEHICKYFKIGGGRMLHAVEDVNLDIHRGETLGLVGESGCGKSTLGRTLMGIYQPTKGKLIYDGKPVDLSNKKDRFAFAKKAQIVFQDPYSSLNPRQTVEEIIKEPLKLSGRYKKRAELDEKTEELMRLVGIDERLRLAYPHELDGGRRQRIGIARALALSPDFIVCDEPVSALDVSIQAQVINLLHDLQERMGLTYLFIAHDLNIVKYISDRIAVMYLGSMVELATSDELYANTLHPYSKALLSAVPIPDPKLEAQKKRQIIEGDVPSPINKPKGCAFSSRCPLACDKCRQSAPTLKEAAPGHFVACHLVEAQG